jgi:hypothetical protein
MKPYVLLENFGHETVYAAAHVCQEHENVRAIIACVERAFDRVDLPANTFNTSNQLLFFFFEM